MNRPGPGAFAALVLLALVCGGMWYALHLLFGG
jgi:hypothetical protein